LDWHDPKVVNPDSLGVNCPVPDSIEMHCYFEDVIMPSDSTFALRVHCMQFVQRTHKIRRAGSTKKGSQLVYTKKTNAFYK
jgi:hypothetical protein